MDIHRLRGKESEEEGTWVETSVASRTPVTDTVRRGMFSKVAHQGVCHAPSWNQNLLPDSGGSRLDRPGAHPSTSRGNPIVAAAEVAVRVGDRARRSTQLKTVCKDSSHQISESHMCALESEVHPC